MNSAQNEWEADPWDASDETADIQLSGYQARAANRVSWSSIHGDDRPIFGFDRQTLIRADVEFYATHDGEDLLLMQLAWHGFPDPPEWRLATRPHQSDEPWASWGYFDHLPEAWVFQKAGQPHSAN